MKFVCDRCQTKYSIADEKVRGKILKVRCKACTNIITVRDEAAAGAPRRAPSVAVPTLGPSASRPALPAARPPAAPAPRPPARPPAVPDDGVQWYLALDGNRTGPFTRRQLVDKVAPFSGDADLHVWNEQLGSWKPPSQVPAIAADLAARKPSGPPPFPGAPRRLTPPPMPALAAAAPRQTGAHAVAAAIGPGVGLKLPPPSGPPGGRRITGPVSRPAVMAAAAALAHAPSQSGHSQPQTQTQMDDGLDVDPSTLLETPAPQPHMLHGLAGNNGFNGAHASGAADSAVPNLTPGAADRSDVLNTLNLAGAGASGAPPRLLSSDAMWQSGTAQASGARQRSTRIVIAFLCVIALICAVFFLNMTKKARPVTTPAPAPKAVASDPLAGLAEKAPEPPPVAVAPTPVAPVAPPPVVVPLPAAGHGKGKSARGARGRGASPVAMASAPGATAPVVDANARYRDTSRPGLAITGGGGSSRPAPSQSDISRVINNNRGGIKNCYQRALLRDTSLTHGKITVQVTIGISGRVKRTSIDGPPQFRSLDPCIKEVVGRWAFPQAGDEYGTEFVYVFQGNE